MSARAALTYRDYAAFPDDGRRHEIHDGDLCVTPASTPLHQIVLVNLTTALAAHVKTRDLGCVLLAPLDVILSDRPGETTILQPDLLFLDRVRLGRMSARGIEGAPALVIEILSPSTATIDRTRKRALHARYGVPFLWLVDPDARVIEAHVLRDGAYVVAVSAAGDDRVDLPPFADLGLVPSTLWP